MHFPATSPLNIGHAKSNVFRVVRRKSFPAHSLWEYSVILWATTHPSLVTGAVTWLGLGRLDLRAFLRSGGLFTRLTGDADPSQHQVWMSLVLSKLPHERGMLVPLCLEHVALASSFAGLQDLCSPGTAASLLTPSAAVVDVWIWEGSRGPPALCESWCQRFWKLKEGLSPAHQSDALT